ncbi:MAG TPA: EpsI family protein [Sphingomonas sp.]|jgi:EpsI family protein|nr:EpsI family protein [Sphingomonas sp.]
MAARLPLPTPGRREIVLGAALVGAMGAGTLLRPRGEQPVVPAGLLDRVVPMQFDAYRFAGSSGLIVPPPEEMNRPIYDQVLTRVYAKDGDPPVMLLIAYGSAQNATLALHRPEACYPASGYDTGKAREVPLAGATTGAASVLTAARGDRVEQIYFWTRIGRGFPVSPIEERLAVLSANLRGLLPDGVLVRLSVRSVTPAAALDQMMRFNALLLGAVGSEGRRLLLGPGGQS